MRPPTRKRPVGSGAGTRKPGLSLPAAKLSRAERALAALGLAGWAAALAARAPAAYADPPPPEPAAAPSRAERVALYAARRAAGRGLWHPDDRLAPARDREGPSAGLTE